MLVNYSTAVQKNDLVMIGGATVGAPLVTALYQEVLRAGGHPIVALRPDDCAEIHLREASDQQLVFEDPVAQYAIENVDVRIAYWGSENTKALSKYDPAKAIQGQSSSQEVHGNILGTCREGGIALGGHAVPLSGVGAGRRNVTSVSTRTSSFAQVSCT